MASNLYPLSLTPLILEAEISCREEISCYPHRHMRTFYKYCTAYLPSILSCCLFLSLGSASIAAEFVGDAVTLPPTASYRTIQTEHFEIIFPRELEPLTPLASRYLEQAHTTLSPYWKYEPSRRTTVILTDHQDFSNGIASPIGHQGLILYCIAPEPWMSINDTDNWLRNLIIHEYTHYLSLHQTRGIFKVLTYVFGDVLLPNAIWPRWLSEGVAVYAETHFSKLGRGSGPYYQTITRDAIARKTLGIDYLNYNQIMGEVPEFPFGESDYYAGYAISSQLRKYGGDEAHGKFAVASGGRFPFFLDGTIESALKREDLSFPELWKAWIEDQIKRWQPEITKLNSPKMELLSREDIISRGARLDPTENLIAFTQSSSDERSQLKILDLKTKSEKTIEVGIVTPGLSWSKDGKYLYFSKVDYADSYRFFGDVYRWSRDTKKVERLTNDARAKDPTECGENRILFSTMRAGVSKLISLNTGSREMTTLLTLPLGQRIANPRCDANQKYAYFSIRKLNPYEEIDAFDLEKHSLHRIVGGEESGIGALYPEPTTAGLLFTKVNESYFDLAFAPWATKSSPSIKNTSTQILAHSTGGYWFPQSNTQSITTTYFSSKGMQIALLPPLSSLQKEGKQDEEKNAEPPQLASTSEKSPTPVEAINSHHYILLKSLFPRVFAPQFTYSRLRTTIGAGILGWDDTDQLEYILMAHYDSPKKGMNGSFTTFHRLGGFRLGLFGSSDLTSYEETSLGERYYFEERQLGLRLSRPFPHVNWNIEPFISARWAQVHFGGQIGHFNFDPESRFGFGTTYDSRRSFTYSLAAEDGFQFTAETQRIQTLGPNHRIGAWKSSLEAQYVTPLFPKHSALSFTGYYGLSFSPKPSLPVSYISAGSSGKSEDLDPPLRGYPLGSIFSRRAYILQTEYRIPIEQVFWGVGNFPFFMRNHGLGFFTDVAKFEFNNNTYSPALIGAGAAYIMNVNLFYLLPLRMRIEYARGFNVSYKGEHQFSIGLSP